MFHCIAECCADSVVGGPGSKRSLSAWRQVYRSLQHGFACERCKNKKMMMKFPNPIRSFAVHFVTMQTKRHEADYDPHAKKLYKSAVKNDIAATKSAIETFTTAKPKDRRAFSALVLLKDRPAG
jgi:hypothetical protein